MKSENERVDAERLETHLLLFTEECRNMTRSDIRACSQYFNKNVFSNNLNTLPRIVK